MRTSIIICLLFFFISNLHGQETNEAKRKFFIGGAAGLSQLNLKSAGYQSGDETSLSFPNFKVGMMLSEQMAILLYLPGSLYTFNHEGRSRDRGFEAILPSVQHWLGDRVWVLAGIGIGMDAPAFYDIKSPEERKFHFGWATAGALGFEFLRKEHFVFDIQARGHYGSINLDNGSMQGLAFSVLLGVNLWP